MTHETNTKTVEMLVIDLYGEPGIEVGLTTYGDTVDIRHPECVVIVIGHACFYGLTMAQAQEQTADLARAHFEI